MERIETQSPLPLVWSLSRLKEKTLSCTSQDKIHTCLKISECCLFFFESYFAFNAVDANIYGGKRLTSHHIALLGAFTLHWTLRIAHHYRHRDKFNNIFELIKKSFPTTALAAILGGATVSISGLAQECNHPLTLCDSIVNNYSNYIVDTQYHQNLCKNEQPCDPIITDPRDPNVHQYGVKCAMRDDTKLTYIAFQGDNSNICSKMAGDCKELINSPQLAGIISFWHNRPAPIILLKESAVNRVNKIFENYNPVCISNPNSFMNQSKTTIGAAIAFGIATISFLVRGILSEKALFSQLYLTKHQYSMIALQDLNTTRANTQLL